MKGAKALFQYNCIIIIITITTTTTTTTTTTELSIDRDWEKSFIFFILINPHTNLKR